MSAASVSRYLAERGWTRTEWLRHSKTSGYRCEETWDSRNQPATRVSWIPGDEHRGLSPRESKALVAEKVDALSEALAGRYVVMHEKPDQVFGGDPYLMVSDKKDYEVPD